MSQRTHTGGLYCSEGSTHVNRPSVRVRQPPGGSSGFNFFTGESTSAPQATEAPQQAVSSKSSSGAGKKERDYGDNVNIKPYASPGKESNHSTSVSEKVEHQAPSNSRVNDSINNQGALYCSEGNQIRNKPSVRVRNPPGGSSGWAFS